MMKETIKVEGHPGFIRNADNNVILNINKTEVEIARERKRLRKQKENEFEELKNEVSEIKGLLLKLIEKQ